MKFSNKEISRDLATRILQWKYEPPYDFYNNELTEEGLQELLETPYIAVLDEKDQLVGFYCTGTSAQVPAGARIGAYNEDILDIGLGIRPDLTGQGLGYKYMTFILNQLKDTDTLRLTVAAFNSRAIRLYEKIGFEKEMEFQSGDIEFITMIKRAKGRINSAIHGRF